MKNLRSYLYGDEGPGMKNLRSYFHGDKCMSMNNLHSRLHDDEGSLIILTLTLFLLLVVTSLGMVDISDNFLAKRQLIEVGEVAISSAAHQLSLSRYYSGNILMDTSGADGSQFRIPIDCSKALSAFTSEISASALRGIPIQIENWNCSNDEVSATISAEIPTLIRLPLGIGSRTTQIRATIGATSIIGGIRG